MDKLKDYADGRHALAASIADMLLDVGKFNEEIVHMPVPDRPKVVEGLRLDWSTGAMAEEVEEFRDASLKGDVAGAADGLVDLIYFALGRLVEMGVPPMAVFDEVQRANMAKRQGEVSTRPGSMGHDAVKPPDWQPPALDWLLGMRRPGPGVDSMKTSIAEGKPRLSLVPAEFTESVARVFERAADGKYDYWDWLKGRPWSDVIDAAKRHLDAFASGEDADRDTGDSHLAHLGACAAMLLVWTVLHPEKDDRRPRP